MAKGQIPIRIRAVRRGQASGMVFFGAHLIGRWNLVIPFSFVL